MYAAYAAPNADPCLRRPPLTTGQRHDATKPSGTTTVQTTAGSEAVTGDALLVARVRAGDLVAARTFYDLHVVAVYRGAVRLTRDPELARDCTQDVFLRVFERLNQFRGDGPLAALAAGYYAVRRAEYASASGHVEDH